MRGEYDRVRERYRTKVRKIPHPNFTIHKELAKLAFYGGRSETAWVGVTREGIFSEYDIVSAYTLALSSVEVLDYSGALVSNDPYDYTASQIGFARINFNFPNRLLRPTLPVVGDDQRGLIYPQYGTTYATSPEIATALYLGADIEILHGVVIPRVLQMEPVRPFESVLSELNNRRRQHPDGSFENALYKQLGNSLYGKTCQGIKGKKAYNPQTDKHDEIGPSEVTNVFIASYVTGLIRALLSELIAGIPPQYPIISATTDSIITNCPMEEIPLDGPVAQHLTRVRRRLARLDLSARTTTDLLEVKSRTAQLLPWRTRGITTLKSIPGEKLKLARTGLRPPEDVRGPAEQSDWFARAVLTFKPGEKLKTQEPMSFPEAHRSGADYRKFTVKKTVNFDYDHKRRIVDPQFVQVPVPGRPGVTVEYISADTVPWKNVVEFNEYRALFEKWRFSGNGRRLRTRADWEDWQQFLAGTKASEAGVRRTRGGVVQQALRIVLRAYVWQEWGLKRNGPGSSDREVAEKLSAAGYPTNENAFKNAAKRNPMAPLDLPKHAIPAEASGVRDLVLFLLDLWPAFKWQNRVLDAPPGWLDNSTEEKCDLPQNVDLREVEHPVTSCKETKEYYPETPPPQQGGGLITPTPGPLSKVPLRPAAAAGYSLTRIA